MSVLVYQTDAGNALKQIGKFNDLTFKPKAFIVSVTLEKIDKLDPQNAWMLSLMQKECWPIVQKKCKDIYAALKKLDKPATGAAAKKRDEDAQKIIDKALAELGDDLMDVTFKAYKGIIKDKKDYKMARNAAGVKIVVNGAALVASATLTGLAGWSGVGTVVGIVGMVRSTAAIGQQVAALVQGIVPVYMRVSQNLNKMKKQLASPNIKTNTAKQAASTVLNKVFAVEIETLVVTVEGVEKDLALLVVKIKQVKTKAVHLSKAIPEMLDAQEKAQKEFDKYADTFKKSGKWSKDADKAKAALDKVEKKLDGVLTSVSDMSENMFAIEAWATEQHAEIAKLKTKYSSKAVTGVGVATDFVIAAGTFVGGAFSNSAQTVKDLHDASKVVVTSLGLVNDGIGTVKDVAVSMKDAVSK